MCLFLVGFWVKIRFVLRKFWEVCKSHWDNWRHPRVAQNLAWEHGALVPDGFIDKWEWSCLWPVILPSGKVTLCNMAQRWAWHIPFLVIIFKFILPKSTGPRPGWGWKKNKWKILVKATVHSLWEVHLQPPPSVDWSLWIKPQFPHSRTKKIEWDPKARPIFF